MVDDADNAMAGINDDHHRSIGKRFSGLGTEQAGEDMRISSRLPFLQPKQPSLGDGVAAEAAGPGWSAQVESLRTICRCRSPRCSVSAGYRRCRKSPEH